MDININVTGLDPMVAALNNLANAMGAHSLATGVEAVAAVSKAQQDSKAKKPKAGASSAAGTSTTSTGAEESAQSQTAASQDASSSTETSETADSKQETVANSADSAGSTSTDTTSALSQEPTGAPAPMSLDDLRKAAAKAAQQNQPAAQALVNKYAPKLSEVPEDQRQALALELAEVK